jgi:hypothetical protein
MVSQIYFLLLMFIQFFRARFLARVQDVRGNWLVMFFWESVASQLSPPGNCKTDELETFHFSLKFGN